MLSKINQYLFYICAILLIVSAALYITENEIVPYVFAISGAGVAIVYLSNPYKGENFRLKRLNIQQTIAAVLLPVSSYFMFQKKNEWFACLLLSAIIQIYVVTIRFVEEKKEKEKETKD
jgi:hypothetical protein